MCDECVVCKATPLATQMSENDTSCRIQLDGIRYIVLF